MIFVIKHLSTNLHSIDYIKHEKYDGFIDTLQ